ncbi:MAG: beta-ribofuranosylaminobenzene 5'-phosphate synthase family protein [Haloarculaceae archaeon]
MARVSVGARLHFGFQNLSLAHERLYGGVGVALDEPIVDVEANRAPALDCDDDAVRPYLDRVVDVLDVPGAAVTVHERFDRHVGLGSGTQIALATCVAVANAYDVDVAVRDVAPALGRGGRSGIGVATFESGEFVVDGGHPTERFTVAPPETGEWTVPPVVARHEVPDRWRFVVAVPDADPGESGADEDASMRSAVERADPGIAEDIATLVTQELLPAAATADLATFGDAVARLGRLNGAWYADEQGGVYRPPAGTIIDHLSAVPTVAGAGQSSWGPAVYALTTADGVDAARTAARAGLEEASHGGEVLVARGRNDGATVTE